MSQNHKWSDQTFDEPEVQHGDQYAQELAQHSDEIRHTMTTQPSLDELEPIKPKFLDLVENGWASEDNPHQVGIFIRNGYRSGRMNQGKYIVLTDGNGDFWEIGNTKGHKMKVIGNLLRSQQKELLERVRKEVIGEDEDIETIPPQMSTDYINYVHAQNRLRSEQRKALDDIIDIY